VSTKTHGTRPPSTNTLPKHELMHDHACEQRTGKGRSCARSPGEHNFKCSSTCEHDHTLDHVRKHDLKHTAVRHSERGHNPCFRPSPRNGNRSKEQQHGSLIQTRVHARGQVLHNVTSLRGQSRAEGRGRACIIWNPLR
jgi:hypothetical protein